MRICPSCGRRISPQEWHNLPLVGLQETESPLRWLELKTCPCTSTLAKPLDLLNDSWLELSDVLAQSLEAA